MGLSTALPLPRPVPASGRSRQGLGPSQANPPSQAKPATHLMIAVGLVLGAVLLAPEQPRDQEAICHRHNGVAACRVW